MFWRALAPRRLALRRQTSALYKILQNRTRRPLFEHKKLQSNRYFNEFKMVFTENNDDLLYDLVKKFRDNKYCELTTLGTWILYFEKCLLVNILFVVWYELVELCRSSRESRGSTWWREAGQGEDYAVAGYKGKWTCLRLAHTKFLRVFAHSK